MGLDWQLVAPARRGKAKELRVLRKKIQGLDEPGEDLFAKLEELEVGLSDYVTAPRVGIDEAATDFLRTGWRAGQFGKGTWKAILARCHGQVVLQLAEPADAIPLVTGMGAGPFDFRGQQLVFAQELIGEALVEEAFEDHTASQMVEFAVRLERAIAKKRRTRSKNQRDLIAIVDGAVRWLRFWGERGFSFYAWF